MAQKGGRFNKAKGRRSAHNEKTKKYIKQRVRTGKNKLRKLERHLVKHPSDILAQESLERIMTSPSG